MSGANGSATAPVFWAAADLAKVGYAVFPLKDKAPSVEGGFYAATTDLSQVAAWIEEGRAHHDVAFATGLPSGVVVIDADTSEAFERMRQARGEPTVKTKRGGHWYFRHPGNGRVKSGQYRRAWIAKATADTSRRHPAGAVPGQSAYRTGGRCRLAGTSPSGRRGRFRTHSGQRSRPSRRTGPLASRASRRSRRGCTRSWRAYSAGGFGPQ